jgi:hypothetical protein
VAIARQLNFRIEARLHRRETSSPKTDSIARIKSLTEPGRYTDGDRLMLVIAPENGAGSCVPV